MDAQKSSLATLSENTWITLGSACAILGAVIVAVIYVTAIKAEGATNSLRQEQASLRIDQNAKRIDGLEDKMDVVNDRTARMEEMMKFLVGETRRNNKR